MQKKSKDHISKVLGIGERIRYVRQILGMNQSEFAEKIGVESYNTVFRYEKNKRKPNSATIGRICEIGYTTFKWILLGKVNTEICDRLIDSIKSKNIRYEIITMGFGMSSEYLKGIAKYKISPSKKFISKYCDHYDEDRVLFYDFLMFEDDNMEFYIPKSRHKKDNNIKKINEICKLLEEDTEAQDLVLKLLRSRKESKEAAEALSVKNKKST